MNMVKYQKIKKIDDFKVIVIDRDTKNAYTYTRIENLKLLKDLKVNDCIAVEEIACFIRTLKYIGPGTAEY